MWTSTRKRTHDRIPSSRYTLPGSIFITAIFDTININSTHTSCDEFPTWYMIDNGKKKSENAQRSIHSYTRYVYEYIWKDRKISTGSVQSPKLSYTIFVACTLLVLDKISPGIHRTGGCKIGRYTSRREWRHTEGERDYRVFRVSFFGSAECFRAKTKTHDQHAVRGPVLFAYESALPLVCKNHNTPNTDRNNHSTSIRRTEAAPMATWRWRRGCYMVYMWRHSAAIRLPLCPSIYKHILCIKIR